MAQGNYYANLAHSLSTQDTASVANSISSALEGASKATELGYQAGKEANNAFANLLNTKDTPLGNVLNYFSTKEAQSNIEANKQKQLDEASENVLTKQAEALADYNTMQNAYINDITRGATGQNYDDMKSNIDTVIKSASNGNMDYEQYMYYLNNPQLIQNAQKFRNMHNNAESTLDELGNVITSPVDLKVLETFEKLSKDTNFTRLVGRMRDIEAEKDRINKGILTEEDYHKVYKDSRENAYKIAGAYDEKSFRDTMNVMSRKDIITNWKDNFNANVTPVLWEQDPVTAIKKIEEQATNNSISADSVLKNNVSTKQDKPSDETKPKDDSLEGQINSQLESLKHQKEVLEEAKEDPEIQKKIQDVTRLYKEQTSTHYDAIGANSNTGKIMLYDKGSPETRGVVSEFSDMIADNLIPESFRPFIFAMQQGGLALEAYSYFKGKYFDANGVELKGEAAEAAKEADKQAGVKDTDTPEEANNKRKKWGAKAKEYADNAIDQVKNNKKGLAKKAAGGLVKGGGKLLRKVSTIAEAVAGLGVLEDSFAYAMSWRDYTDGMLRPRGQAELDEYNETWEGKDISQYFIDSLHRMENWDLGNSKTFLPGTLEDYEKRLAYLQKYGKRIDEMALTFSGNLSKALTIDRAKEQIKISENIIKDLINMKVLEDKSIAGRIAKIEKDEATLTNEPTQNILDQAKLKEVQQQIADTPNTPNNGKKLTELKNKELDLSANITGHKKGELITNLSDGQANNPDLVTEDKYKFSLKATANLNDETRNSLARQNVNVDAMSKEEATIKWAFRGFIYDQSNGTANMQSIDAISKNENVKQAVQKLETVVTSDNWEGWFASKGKLNDAYKKLVDVLDDEFEKNPIRVSTILSPEEEKEFQHLKNQWKIDDSYWHKIGLFNKSEAASKFAFKIMKYEIYKSQADPRHLDMSNNDNLRRFNESKALNYLYKYKTATEVKDQNAKDNYKIKSAGEKLNEAKNRGSNNMYNSITIEKGSNNNKEGIRISINGTKQQAKIDLDRALKVGDITQQQYDKMMKSLTR